MKKSIYHTIAAIIAMLFLTAESAIAGPVSEEDAYEIVSGQITETGANYYICETDDDSLWQFFVDVEPTKAWAHNCYLISIPKDGESDAVSVSKEKRRFPPKVRMRPYKVEKPPMKTPALSAPSFAAGQRPTKFRGNIYALIVNGGGNVNLNSEYDWNDCAYIYNTLRITYGVPKENIEVLFNDGGVPFADMLDSDDEMVDSNPDLDGDGEKDVTGASTSTNFQNVVNSMAEKISDDDMFFLFLKGPAERSNEDGTMLYFWEDNRPEDNNIVTKNKLATMLQPILDRDCLKNIVLAYNYSGDYPAEFKKEGVFVTTACGKKQEMTRLHGESCYDFPYLWISAINRVDPYGTNVGSDYNEDGYISMLEAFNNVYERREFTANPQYYSSSSKFANMLNMDYILSSDELYIADEEKQNQGWNYLHHSDTSWNSPDIWIRTGPEDEGNNIISSSKAYVYVRVHNNSWKASPEDKKVHVAWSFNSLNLRSDVVMGLEHLSSISTGGYIGAVSLPSIPAFSSTVIEIPWQLSSRLQDVINSDNPLGSVSICAEIATNNGIIKMHTHPSYGDFNQTIRSDRSIAVRNVLLPKYADHGSSTCIRTAFIMRNNLSSTALYNLSFVFDDETIGQHNALLEMPLELYNRWVDSGADSCWQSGLPLIYDDCVHLPISSHYQCNRIPLKPNESVVLNVVSFQNNVGLGNFLHFDLVMKDANGKTIDGMHVQLPFFMMAIPLEIDEDGSISQSFVRNNDILQQSVLKVELKKTVVRTTPTLITISDANTARIVKTIDVYEGEKVCEVNLSGLPKGLYVVNLVECGVIIDNLKISLP